VYLARVIGNVVASVKAEGMQGSKLMLVQPLNVDGEPDGAPHVAADTAQAGEGDLVTCVGSREAALACDPTFVPVDAAIIGIVDQHEMER
jgi:ethanolamine utilization protein EutN